MRWDFRGKRIQRRRGINETSPQFSNPLFKKSSWSSLVVLHPGFFFLALLTIVIGTVYLFLFSPLFNISSIIVEGEQGISESSIKLHVVEQSEQFRIGIIPQNNLLAFSRSGLKELLRTHYDLESLIVTKKLPGTISISFSEKNPFAILVSGENRYYIEENGLLSAEMTTESTIEGYIEIIEEVSLGPPTVGTSVFSSSVAVFIQGLSNRLQADIGVSIEKWMIPSFESEQIHALTPDGWRIFFHMNKDLNQQYDNFLATWNHYFTESPPNEYIDVRILDRVIYK
ncbi:cell division protein FtsQ/DivIB [Patescibacteria group bacterium]